MRKEKLIITVEGIDEKKMCLIDYELKAFMNRIDAIASNGQVDNSKTIYRNYKIEK